MQEVLGCFQERLAHSEESMEDLASEKEMNALTQLLAQSDKPVGTKKCAQCGAVKSLNAFSKLRKNKDGFKYICKECSRIVTCKHLETEKGYLKKRYRDLKRTDKWRRPLTSIKCYFTFDELCAAFEKHKSIYGMRSAWGPGPDHLDQHLPITITTKGDSSWKRRKGKRTPSNLSIDRLDSSKDYTIQNIIFIRGDENARKKDTSYEDCKIQIRLHEEKFGK